MSYFTTGWQWLYLKCHHKVYRNIKLHIIESFLIMQMYHLFGSFSQRRIEARNPKAWLSFPDPFCCCSKTFQALFLLPVPWSSHLFTKVLSVHASLMFFTNPMHALPMLLLSRFLLIFQAEGLYTCRFIFIFVQVIFLINSQAWNERKENFFSLLAVAVERCRCVSMCVVRCFRMRSWDFALD